MFEDCILRGVFIGVSTTTTTIYNGSVEVGINKGVCFVFLFLDFTDGLTAAVDVIEICKGVFFFPFMISVVV